MEIKINIWDDCWIPDNHSRRIMTVHGNQVLTKVSELISNVTGEWDEELLRDNFLLIDVERILQILIF